MNELNHKLKNDGSAPRLPRLAVSVKDASVMIAVSEKSIRRLIDRQLLKPCRALRHLRIPISEIEKLINQ